MTIAAAQLGVSETAEANDQGPRELAALGGAAESLNSPRLTSANLKGKVVLVQFCAYTCINWLRTLPYVRAWAKKYRQGLVVIGVHTPEFPFEHNLENVRRAVPQMRIEYPVVIARSLLTHTQIIGLEGNGRLERVRWRNDRTGDIETREIGRVFLMTGADPNTGWLAGCVVLDEKGFIKTGPDLSSDDLAAAQWPLDRPPYLLETSRPGIFAVGDVRGATS